MDAVAVVVDVVAVVAVLSGNCTDAVVRCPNWHLANCFVHHCLRCSCLDILDMFFFLNISAALQVDIILSSVRFCSRKSRSRSAESWIPTIILSPMSQSPVLPKARR